MVPLSKISDVICGPFGSAIKNTDYQEEGLPLIRITNITKNGYMNYDDIIYITEELGNSLSRSQVVPGDIVISQRGSLGQCAIVDDKFNKLNISANIIAVKNIHNSSAQFIHDYFLSIIGQTLLERNVSGQVQPKITTQDIADLLIPVNCDERKLCQIVVDGYNTYKQKLNQADELIETFEDKISNKFNLLSDKQAKIYFAIRLKQLDGVIDAKRYVNTRSENSHSLADICDIMDERVNVANYESETIDWIRIDDLPNYPTDIESMRTVSALEMEGSFYSVKEGDILVARLGPTILNQKIVMVRSVKNLTLASAEFLVLRCKPNYNPEAVMAILKTEYYKNLMYAHSRGSTPSRYRLNREDALKLPFPDILDNQNALAVEANDIRNKVKTMRLEAEQEWQEAKAQFEKELLGV